MTTEPVTTSEAKKHLRIDSDDPGYSLLSVQLTAARVAVEQYLNASVAQQSRTLTLDAFPTGAINLPFGPVVSVASISYVDTDGAAQTFSSHVRSLDVITPAYGASWPATRDQIGAVTITYTAGMMAGSPLSLPEKYAPIKSAILLTLGDLWQNRETQIVGLPVQINKTCERLLDSYRLNMGV